MISEHDIDSIAGQPVYGSDGEKIGTASQVYLDDQTGRPEWLTVQTGLMGNTESFVPMAEADWAGGRLTVPYDKDTVTDAPRVHLEGGHLEVSDEEELYRHYGRDHGEMAARGQQAGYAEARMRGTRDAYDEVRTDVDPSRAASEDYAMTRSEERLRVGTQRQAVTRVRLRKVIVTEERTITVPVRREEFRLEREPIADADNGVTLPDPNLSDAQVEVVLHEERPVVQMEVVPVERVRLVKELVTENREVTEQVRKEQIETEQV